MGLAIMEDYNGAVCRPGCVAEPDSNPYCRSNTTYAESLKAYGLRLGSGGIFSAGQCCICAAVSYSAGRCQSRRVRRRARTADDSFCRTEQHNQFLHLGRCSIRRFALASMNVPVRVRWRFYSANLTCNHSLKLVTLFQHPRQQEDKKI